MSNRHTTRGLDRRRITEQFDFPLTLASGDQIPNDRRSGRDRRKLDSVARHPLFKGVPFNVIELLAEGCEFRHLDKGEQLLAPNQANSHLFLILEGGLEVHIDQVDSPSGIEIVAGECTGEISIIDGKPASAYVIAGERTLLLAIPENRFWSEFVRYPAIAKNFMKMFAERFRARNDMMQQAIEEHLRFEAMEKELGVAAQIQLSMLPQDLDLGAEVDVFASMQPARHVGGDFYDVCQVTEDKFYVAVGDVAGKGVPASLFVVRAMTILRTEMLKQYPVEFAVSALNRALCKNNDTFMFVTLAVVEFDRRTGRGRYVSAGHNPLVVGRAGESYQYLAKPAGILAGIEPDTRYEAVDLDLARDDVLLMYSDGVTEAMRWDLINAWPSEWKGAPLDAMSREIAIESLTLVFEEMQRA